MTISHVPGPLFFRNFGSSHREINERVTRVEREQEKEPVGGLLVAQR